MIYKESHRKLSFSNKIPLDHGDENQIDVNDIV
jgi:hypothetical protein